MQHADDQSALLLPDASRTRVALDKHARHSGQDWQPMQQIGARLLERLDLLRLTPSVVVAVGCDAGTSAAALGRRYRRALSIDLQIAPGLARKARQQAPWWRKPNYLCGDVTALPLADASCDMLFSHFALAWSSNPQQTIREFRRVLKPGGVLMFSSLGPDTLRELRHSWASIDDCSHVHDFIDMHDIGDILLHAGFADPVVDMEMLTLTYADVPALLRDLKALGCHNTTAQRRLGLLGKRQFQRLCKAYERFRRDDRLPVSWEVVYGHAWQMQRQSRTEAGHTVTVPLIQLTKSGQRW